MSAVLAFFHEELDRRSGDGDLEKTVCDALMSATGATEASVWRVDDDCFLCLSHGTNVSPQEVSDVRLRIGEGISGAAALARRTIRVFDAHSTPQHDSRVDETIGFRTRSMISSPILFGGQLFGVLNILNHASGDGFQPSQERAAAVAATLLGSHWSAGPPEPRSNRPATRSKPKAGQPVTGGEIVGISPAVRDLLCVCARAAQAEGSQVLIRGESGTGKELVARRIHEQSPRAGKPLLTVNCAAIAPNLIESELFGHVKGAYTGADGAREGHFVAASGGTLLLDEIGEMSLECQAKILRVIEEGRVVPLGAEKARAIDTRVIASTHRDLHGEVEAGRFRRDLYYRLCGLEVVIPPLRERVEDISLLAQHFLNQANRQSGRERPQHLSREAEERLTHHDWPGNVRELRQAIFAASAMCEGEAITLEDFPPWFRREMVRSLTGRRGDAAVDGSAEPSPGHLTPFSERERYEEALHATAYRGTGRLNVAAAARRLGIPRKTLMYRLKKLGLI